MIQCHQHVTFKQTHSNISCLPFPEGFSCVPTKFDSALVETPNKVDLIQTVEACELKESCYRVPFLEYYYEIVYDADGVKEEKLKVSHTHMFDVRLRCLRYSIIFIETNNDEIV